MEFEIQLAVPFRRLPSRDAKVGGFFVEAAAEIVGPTEFHRRKTLHPFGHQFDALNLFNGRPPAAIPEAIWLQPSRHRGLIQFGDISFGKLKIRRQDRTVVVVPGGQMGQYRSTVDSNPVETHMGKLVSFTPTDLVGNKSVESGTPDDLGHRGGKTKGVRKIEMALRGISAEGIAPPTGAVKDLSDKTLTAGCVAIRLDPHRPSRFPSPLANPGGNPLKELGRILANPLILLSLTAEETKVRRTFHDPIDGGKCPQAFSTGLRDRPEPSGIDVSMADGDTGGSARRAVATEQRFEVFVSSLHRRSWIMRWNRPQDLSQARLKLVGPRR